MDTPDTTSITATFVAAILSLILPASALALDKDLRQDEPARVQAPSGAREAEPFLHDPILESRWGPGDPNLVVPQFHFTFPGGHRLTQPGRPAPAFEAGRPGSPEPDDAHR